MRTPWLSEPEARLLQPPEPAKFSAAELAGLPEPVQRHLAQAITPGTALATSARLRMRGHIKVGRWLPFRARQLLNPHLGFVWVARAAGVIAGSDRYVDGNGGLDWKLLSLLTVAHAEGPDVSRSTASRAGAEAIWLPTALLPRFGVRWSAGSGDQVTASFRVGDTPVELGLRLDGAGRIASLVFDRWGDPDNRSTFGWHQFGGEFTGYRSFQGLTIPSEGRLGWFYGENGWPPASSSDTRSPTSSRSPARPPTLAGDRMSLRNRLANPLERFVATLPAPPSAQQVAGVLTRPQGLVAQPAPTHPSPSAPARPRPTTGLLITVPTQQHSPVARPTSQLTARKRKSSGRPTAVQAARGGGRIPPDRPVAPEVSAWDDRSCKGESVLPRGWP